MCKLDIVLHLNEGRVLKVFIHILMIFCFMAVPAHAQGDAAPVEKATASEDPLLKWQVLPREKLSEDMVDAAQKKNKISKKGEWLQHKDFVSDDSSAVALPWQVHVEGRLTSVQAILRNFISQVFLDRSQLTSPDVFMFSYHHARTKDRLPRLNGLSKWAKPIRITFKTAEGDFVVDEEKYDYLISHLKTLIPPYAEASGLDISYIRSTYPERSDANVFIVLNLYEGNQNAFKHNTGYSSDTVTYYESLYDFPLVRFTPEARSQVDGFFIPNSLNEIEAATCYLNPAMLPEALNKALLHECLKRVLGFPGMSLFSGGVSSNWNSAFDSVSFSLSDNSEDEQRPSEEQWRLDLANMTGKIFASDKHANTSDGKPPFFPTTFDLLDVSLLYCGEVRAGEDAYNTVITLLKTDLCGNNQVGE